MDVRPASLVRVVSEGEPWSEVIDEAKSETWTHRLEHALVRIENSDLLLVRGGADGVAFEVDESGAVLVKVDGQPRRVTLLAWHTHPRPTGPSDHDREFLRRLGQRSSMLYEMFGDGRGTLFYALPEDEVKR